MIKLATPTYRIITLCFTLCLFVHCRPGTVKESVEPNRKELIVAFQELSYSDTLAIKQAMQEMKTNYSIITDSTEVNLLYIRSVNDSIFFDFTVFDKKVVSYQFNLDEDYKVKGFIMLNARLLLIFDNIGVFETKNIYKNIVFGKQFVDDVLYYEPLKYRYYLNKNKKLTFMEESWF